MSVAGPRVLAALDEALHDIRREEDEIVRKLGRSAERIAKVRDTTVELLHQLAAGRLEPELTAELSSRIALAQTAARATLKDRGAELAASMAGLGRLEREHAGLVADRSATLEEIDRQQAALRTLSSRIAAAIARDRDYERQQQNLAQLKAVAVAARAKARQADLDREQRGRPYRDDPLFSYLLGRGYGTPQYGARGLVARLDRRVAKLIGFETAFEHYQMLNAWPQLLRAHAELQAAKAAEAESEIDEVERTAIDAAGGNGVRLALSEAQAKLAAIDARLLQIQDERDAATQAQTVLAGADDAEFERATNAFAQALGSPDLSSLITRARRLAGPVDPVIAQLDDARLRVIEERTDIGEQHSRLRTLAARRRALEDIEYEFKALKFDDPRSLFRDDGLIGETLSRFLTGAIEAQTYWAAFRRSQSWSAGTSDWGGGVGLPRHGRQTMESPPRVEESFTRPRAATAGAVN